MKSPISAHHILARSLALAGVIVLLLINALGTTTTAGPQSPSAPQGFDLFCDDGDDCFSYNGGWNPPSNPNQYCKYSGDMRFGYACWLAADCQPDNDHYSVFWRPYQVSGFIPGNYEVFAYISRCDSATPHTQSAKYYLRRSGDSAATAPLIRTVNQAHPYQDNNDCSDGARWASLGTHYFDSGTYVELRAWTDESGPQWGTRHHVIFADAIKFSWVSYDDLIQPDGQITAPANESTIGPGTINITANAWDNPDGSGVNRVEFYVFYDGRWYWIGNDSSSPYSMGWPTPSSLHSQRVKLAIHVIDNAGNVTIDPGGIRTVNFQESINPQVQENWVPANRRAYLNQRSLVSGDAKCGATSMAMMLAMNGLIGSDYNTMANKANEMYPRTLQGGVPYIYKMRNELRRQGAVSEYYNVSVNAGWALVRQEVNAGRPVMVRTSPGVVTGPGHVFVAVGYRESGTARQLIVYDPYGRWLGSCCPSQYDRNTTDPGSHKGRWVFYDFARVFGASNYLVTARAPGSATSSAIAASPDTPPDEVSDEAENIGIYEGVPIKVEVPIFLPLVIKNH